MKSREKRRDQHRGEEIKGDERICEEISGRRVDDREALKCPTHVSSEERD